MAELRAEQTGSRWSGSRRYPTGLDLGSVYANKLKESWTTDQQCFKEQGLFTLLYWYL